MSNQWDRAMLLMVQRYRDWTVAYHLAKHYYDKQAPGTYSAYHWGQMVDAFERSRTVGKWAIR